ncbi:BTAD domain-containing putative transcriptional regulator [Lentzea sp. NPDC059081]|uniref:BTAD domain-containing putative transcriptional regulator n=1 Tax=Lentzea sp. NPDC059081 TaxID=3346719 RepID=UPI0036B9B98E
MDGGARLRVSLLSAFEVLHGEDVLAVTGARLQGVLVRLALAGGRPVEPGVLIDAIWGEQPPAGPAAALQTLVTRLRRALGPADMTGDVVVQVAGGYRLAVDAADVDALRFEQLTADGRERLRAGDPEGASTALAEAVTVWRDDPGAEPAVIAAVAPAHATRLAQLSVEVLADLAEAEVASGRAESAIARLTGLLAEHATHERAAALLMDALAAAGRQAEALSVYEKTRVALADEFGADPGSALRDRHLRMLRPEKPVAVPETRPDPARRSVPLPASVTSFVGRDDDLARVSALLSASRLVTVLGPGGAGKTRLALEAARRHRDEYRDGAWLSDLASVTEPAKVPAAVLGGIGLRGVAVLAARRQVDGDDLDVLAGELGGENLLLVDNCEHLIDAVAHMVTALLLRCPGLRVLATSREPLAVDGEALVPLGPLELPDTGDGVDEARRTASVRLFFDRAAAVQPGFDIDASTLPLVRDVVRGLDGIPLALELAAARLRTLSLPDLAAGLSDRFRLLTTGSRTAPPRHRTLRAVIAWSWELLTDHERTVAKRISVLPGGVTPASATAVCAGTPVPAADVPDLLAALVDRSLLELAPSSGRYRMLETIREYGAERLTDTDDLTTARDLAAAHFTDLMARHDPRLRGRDQLAAMDVVGAEHDNILAALRHLCTTHDSRGAIALVLNMTWYWQMFGNHPDGAHWLGEALAVPGGEPTPERDCVRAIHLLNQVNVMAGTTADQDEMRELAHRLLAHHGLPGHHRVYGPVLLALLEDEAAPASFRILADGDDAWLSALAHMFLGENADNEGELDRTRTHVEASLARFRQAGDRWGQAATLPMRAQFRRYDDLDGALADLREAWTLAGQFGTLSPGDQLYRDLQWIDLHLRRGDTGQALGTLHSARERARQASSAEMQVLIDAREADVQVRLGDLGRAAALLDRSDRRLLDGTVFPADRTRILIGTARAALCLAQGDLPGADVALRQAHASAVSTGEMPVLSSVAVKAAALAAAHGQDDRSAVLLGIAARLRGAHDATDPEVRELIRGARDTLGEKEFDDAYAQGWDLDTISAAAAVSWAPRQPTGASRTAFQGGSSSARS